MICMIHDVSPIENGVGPEYLGSVYIDDSAVDDPLVAFDNWWEEYQFEDGDDRPRFLDWLINKHYAGAEEQAFDQEAPNMPLQVYLGY